MDGKDVTDTMIGALVLELEQLINSHQFETLKRTVLASSRIHIKAEIQEK
jgi:hypothetical protein